MKSIPFLAALMLAPLSVAAGTMPEQSHLVHGTTQDRDTPNREPGQSAFAAIAEIVAILESDPQTDWSKVDIQALRDHLADMDKVTLHTQVTVKPITGGAEFAVAGDTDTATATQGMMQAHAPFLAEATGFDVETHLTADGAVWRVVSSKPADVTRIRRLGFYGLLATGAHHQAHHLAIARGMPVH
jgi:hypothetical protein